MPIDSDIFVKGEGKRMIAVTERILPEKAIELSKYAEIIVEGKNQVDLKALLFDLKNKGINRLMVKVERP